MPELQSNPSVRDNTGAGCDLMSLSATSSPGAGAFGAQAHHTAHSGSLTATLQMPSLYPSHIANYYLLGH